jgi:hypothetical protein
VHVSVILRNRRLEEDMFVEKIMLRLAMLRLRCLGNARMKILGNWKGGNSETQDKT